MQTCARNCRQQSLKNRAMAKPDDIRFAEALPKTRSGKIMRRLSKQIAAGGEIKGDTTTSRFRCAGKTIERRGVRSPAALWDDHSSIESLRMISGADDIIGYQSRVGRLSDRQVCDCNHLEKSGS